MNENTKSSNEVAPKLHFTDGLVIRIRELTTLFHAELGLDTAKAMKLAVMVAVPATTQQLWANPSAVDPFRPQNREA